MRRLGGRWLWAVYLGAVFVAAYVCAIPVWHIAVQGGNGSWLAALGPVPSAAVLTGLNALFLMPVRKPRLAAAGPAVWVSLAIAGLLVSALVVGLAAVVITGIVWLIGWYEGDTALWVFVAMGAGLLGVWAVATPVLYAFVRKQSRESALRRVAAGLFVGTIIESAAIIPIDVLMRRQESCYCSLPSYLTLMLCGAVGVFALGPAVFLPLLARRRKRWLLGRCERCGYDMTAHAHAERCPECGLGWRAAKRSSTSGL